MVDDCVYHSFSDLFTHFALLYIVSNIRFGWLCVFNLHPARTPPSQRRVNQQHDHLESVTAPQGTQKHS